jgi:hypothetical protein
MHNPLKFRQLLKPRKFQGLQYIMYTSFTHIAWDLLLALAQTLRQGFRQKKISGGTKKKKPHYIQSSRVLVTSSRHPGRKRVMAYIADAVTL